MIKLKIYDEQYNEDCDNYYITSTKENRMVIRLIENEVANFYEGKSKFTSIGEILEHYTRLFEYDKKLEEITINV